MTARLSIDEDELEDESILDELEDFDSKDFWRPVNRAPTDYLSSMWGGSFGIYDNSREDGIIAAHEMVTSFVNTFSRTGVRYLVLFDPHISTAGTDMDLHKVVITPAPLLDRNLTVQEAGLILTGLSVHEISHPRYGRGTYDAVKRAFPNSRAAARVSNVLDDIRIEQRFIDDYPGYAGVFEPTLEYVAKGMIARNGGQQIVPTLGDPLNLMTAAVRYESSADWSDPGAANERDWWKAWADRWAREDAPRRHVEGVREALRHMVSMKIEIDLGGSGEPGDGDGDQQGAGERAEGAGSAGPSGYDDDEDTDEAGDSGGDEKIDADGLEGEGGTRETESVEDQVNELSDGDLGKAADEGDATPLRDQLPTCAGVQSVDRSAVQQGVDKDRLEMEREEAQKIIKDAEFYEDDGMGGKIDVARSLKQLIHGSRSSEGFQKSDVASRYIRDALMASRTGHENTAHYQKRGRLDQRALHRVTTGDFRLFDRKTAESPGRYVLWMLLDRSGSMDGVESRQAAQVATAIADATRHVDTVRAAVWAWSDAFRKQEAYTYRAGVALAWQSGQPTTEIARTMDLQSGGTPDGQILSWAWRAIKRDARPNETPVILMCSDGWGASNLGQIIEDGRAHGVLIYSVAFGQLDHASQSARYGRDGFVPWQGNIIATSRPLAKLIARIVGRDRRRQR